MRNDKDSTGHNLELIVRCECGHEHEGDKDFSFESSDFVVAVCECGQEFCEECEKECFICNEKDCENTICTICVDKKKICEDCQMEKEYDE